MSSPPPTQPSQLIRRLCTPPLVPADPAMSDTSANSIPPALHLDLDRDLDLDQFVADFKRNVSIKDRSYRFVQYKDVFVGADAVQWMVTSGVAETRPDAVNLGLLLQDAGLIEHVVRDHHFKDDHLFYRFINDSDRGGVPLRKGRLSSWADVIAAAPQTPRTRALVPQMPDPDIDSMASTVLRDHPPTSLVWPHDPHNIRLLDNVHPSQWIPPVTDTAYNLLVIGAGAAGLVASSAAAGLGARVALIEANLLGGDCLNAGCVPSKSLIHAANLAHTLRHTASLGESGISFSGPISIDFAATMQRLRRIRADISRNDSALRYTRKLGVDVYFGFATFTSENSVVVNDTELTFRKCVIATGASPALPSIPGLSALHDRSVQAMGKAPHCAVMTNETFFNMTTMPRRLAVIGTGVVGMELGQAMQRLGASVTLFGRSGRVLPKEDVDLAELVKQQMVEDGCEFRLGVDEYKGVELTGKTSQEGYQEIKMVTVEDEGETHEYKFDAILVSAGRKPNVANLSLESAGVKFDLKTGVIVNDMLQTSNSRVFAIGDCCSEFKFTHVADFMARMVIRNALFFGKDKMSNLLIPYATFTTPELAHVGLYEADMRRKKLAFKTFEKEFSDNDRAICDSATKGLVRIHVEEKSDTILGASIVGEGAGNMISEISVAMQAKMGLGALASVIHPYPTTAEAVRQTGDLYNKTRLTNTVKQVLRGVIKIQR